MKITKQDIRNLVTGTIYLRGETYYRQKRVRILEIDPHYFEAVVSGTDDYIVTVEEEGEGWFFAECTCPYWDDCKHIVAALLTAKDHYEHDASTGGAKVSDPIWKLYLAQVGQEQDAQSTSKPKWQLFYTLSLSSMGWTLHPQKATIRKDGSLGVAHNIGYNDIFDNRIVCSRNDRLVLSFLEKWNEVESLHYYYFQRPRSYKFKYGDKVGFLLNLLQESRVYLPRYENPEAPLKFASEKAQIEFCLSHTTDEAQFVAQLTVGDETSIFDDEYRVLSSEPVWLLRNDTAIEVADLNNASGLIPFTRSGLEVTVPKKDVPNFLNSLTSQTDLFENLRLPKEARTKTVDKISEKRLYLSEIEDGILVNLRFSYDGVEVDSNETRQALWGSGAEENSFIRVVRDFDQEAEVKKKLMETSVKVIHNGKIITRKNKALHWLTHDVPELAGSSFVVFGEENLKRYKVNRYPAKVRVAVESGIDWFDVKMEIDFGGILLSLNELRKALKQKRHYVKLADGSSAVIPKEWLDRFRHVFNLSETEEGRLKLSHFHVTLIDELFAEASQKDFDSSYHEKLRQLKNFEGIKEVTIPDSLQGILRPYQKAGYDWLHFLKEFQFGGCLADDMGLGKTIQALTLLLSEYQNGKKEPSLIVCPTSVIFNWINEIERFAPCLRVYKQTGDDRDRTPKNYDNYELILTSYGTLRQDILFLKDVQFNYVILDESQNIKNPVSQTAKAAKVLKAKHRLALTGTPVENTTIELWSLFSFLNPGLLGNLNYFKNAFARPIEQNRNQEAGELLQKMVFPFVLRRTKEQVEQDLPPKVENRVYCEMSSQQEKVYKQWRDYYRAKLLKQIADVGMDKSRMSVLEGLTKLRQIACHPILVEETFPGKVGKYDILIEYFDELLAEGHKVLVFSQFVRMLAIIRRYLDSARISYEYLDGQTRNRERCVERFQNEETCKIFLISLRAGGTGLNLTAADYVIHYDPWWNPAVETQATDRTHRIGQDKHVFVYKMITKGSVEEKIVQLQNRKKDLVSSLITTDVGFFKHLTVEDIEALFS
ncbi:DEAD/DEAH box helicase family protein [candidate division KSB1 bacterium]|nr:DEAD/DEAH box helicase family protein [candidate division KSB1 bacterium]NIR73255.1 DEAD/DEAH box helicase family protein [candidate division KSB1 bacterium]NIS26961.1 DEAD/DEAH box helicase family protein [candidate division KSB1 bacterium]NIT73800.1 DEAD/DEAH box helicase family protein [candidate division KSB1 bacterium]NIU27705.1 DEAD/DEAH box helicase family protein [candidate division KSB1 bacterium]